MEGALSQYSEYESSGKFYYVRAAKSPFVDWFEVIEVSYYRSLTVAEHTLDNGWKRITRDFFESNFSHRSGAILA